MGVGSSVVVGVAVAMGTAVAEGVGLNADMTEGVAPGPQAANPPSKTTTRIKQIFRHMQPSFVYT